MRMMIAIALALALAGCAGSSDRPETIVSENKLTMVAPPSYLYQCDIVTTLPAYKTLTDAQVARLLSRLYKDNKTCFLSMQALKDYIEAAKTNVEDKSWTKRLLGD